MAYEDSLQWGLVIVGNSSDTRMSLEMISAAGAVCKVGAAEVCRVDGTLAEVVALIPSMLAT